MKKNFLKAVKECGEPEATSAMWGEQWQDRTLVLKPPALQKGWEHPGGWQQNLPGFQEHPAKRFDTQRPSTPRGGCWNVMQKGTQCGDISNDSYTARPSYHSGKILQGLPWNVNGKVTVEKSINFPKEGSSEKRLIPPCSHCWSEGFE